MWGEKPYYSLDYHLKETYGEKIYKVSLNGGMTCPNGTVLWERGDVSSAARAEAAILQRTSGSPLRIRLNPRRKIFPRKFPARRFIAYFQAYTNTYAPVDYLERIFTEAISHKDIVGLSIGTRPDCLGEDVCSLLERLNAIKPVTVELGLQTIHEPTARLIRRGYPLSCFDSAVRRLPLSGNRSRRPYHPGAAPRDRRRHAGNRPISEQL